MRKFLNRFSMYKMKRENSLLVPLYLLAFLLLASCAKMGQPDGGWYDETPPKVIGADPADGGINVKSKKVNIYFDEFIKLDNPSEKVVEIGRASCRERV